YRSHRAVSTDARQSRLLSDGMGRQRAPDGTPRAELLRRALRSIASVRFGICATRRTAETAEVGVAAEFHRALQPADRRRRKSLRAVVAVPRPLSRLVDDLRDDWPARSICLAARVPPPAPEGPRISD